MDTGFETRIDFSALNEKIGLLREQMARVIIGQRQVVDLLLTALLADGHVLIEGVPGVAKTLMAKVLSHLISSTNKILVNTGPCRNSNFPVEGKNTEVPRTSLGIRSGVN